MKSIRIYLHSDVANIATNTPSYKWSEVNHLARKIER